MKISTRKGLGFGLTSGIITTLGLIVGLNSGTYSKFIILQGILIIAIADALSDAFGIHISEESGSNFIKAKQIWESTFSTFLFKLIFASSFIIPILTLKLQIAIFVSIIWGLFLLTIFSFYIAKQKKLNPMNVIVEHLFITVIVILITHIAGYLIRNFVVF